VLDRKICGENADSTELGLWSEAGFTIVWPWGIWFCGCPDIYVYEFL